MPKAYWISAYHAVHDENKLAAYAKLALHDALLAVLPRDAPLAAALKDFAFPAKLLAPWRSAVVAERTAAFAAFVSILSHRAGSADAAADVAVADMCAAFFGWTNLLC